MSSAVASKVNAVGAVPKPAFYATDSNGGNRRNSNQRYVGYPVNGPYPHPAYVPMAHPPPYPHHPPHHQTNHMRTSRPLGDWGGSTNRKQSNRNSATSNRNPLYRIPVAEMPPPPPPQHRVPAAEFPTKPQQQHEVKRGSVESPRLPLTNGFSPNSVTSVVTPTSTKKSFSEVAAATAPVQQNPTPPLRPTGRASTPNNNTTPTPNAMNKGVYNYLPVKAYLTSTWNKSVDELKLNRGMTKLYQPPPPAKQL